MTAWRRQVEAFREWWSRRPSDGRWRQVGVAALTLVLSLIALAVWQRAALPILFLTPVAVCIVLGLLWPDAREWLIENTLPLGALLLSGWLLGAFVLWLVVNAVWANQAQRLAGDYTTLTVADVPLTASVAYPAVALADAADNALPLSFSADRAAPLPRQVLTATVTLSDTLAFATAGGPSTRDFLVPLTAGPAGQPAHRHRQQRRLWRLARPGGDDHRPPVRRRRRVRRRPEAHRSPGGARRLRHPPLRQQHHRPEQPGHFAAAVCGAGGWRCGRSGCWMGGRRRCRSSGPTSALRSRTFAAISARPTDETRRQGPTMT